MSFQWDENNEQHVAAHGVTPHEAEEAMTDPLRLALPTEVRRGELRGYILGATILNRVLMVIYTIRAPFFRVVTAFPARPRDERRYRRRLS